MKYNVYVNMLVNLAPQGSYGQNIVALDDTIKTNSEKAAAINRETILTKLEDAMRMGVTDKPIRIGGIIIGVGCSIKTVTTAIDAEYEEGDSDDERSDDTEDEAESDEPYHGTCDEGYALPGAQCQPDDEDDDE